MTGAYIEMCGSSHVVDGYRKDPFMASRQWRGTDAPQIKST